MRRLILPALAALPILAALPAATAIPAAAQNARDYQYQRSQAGACPRGLKMAAGACVRRCPNGYQDMGRSCRLKNMSR